MGTLAERIAPPNKPPRASAKGAGLRAVAFLLLALVAAGSAGLLFKRYLERGKGAAAVPLSSVVVATEAVPAGEVLRAAEVKTVQWPRAYLPEGAVRDPKELVGKVLLSPIVPGEVLLSSMLASSEAGRGLAALLPPEMRAVAVRVDDVVGVAGFIHPDDRVDVLVTMKPREDTDVPPVSKMILQDVRVLAVGRQTDRDKKNLDKALPVTVATLMVDSGDAERLALATTKGKILLALRSRVDGALVKTPGVEPEALLGDGWRRFLPRPPPPVASERRHHRRRRENRVAEAPPRSENVEILRGDRFETRRFQAGGETP